MGPRKHAMAKLLAAVFCFINGFVQLLRFHCRIPTSVEWMNVSPDALHTTRLVPSEIPEKVISPPPLRKRPKDDRKRAKLPTVDIISTGSLHRQEYLEAQRATFATHYAVRTFRTTTEHDDADARCHLDLNNTDIEAITKHCHKTFPDQTEASRLIRQKKFMPKKNSTGWLCAQKRPIDGLAAMLQEYETDDMLPDYLMLIDDDSYVNVPDTLQFLTEFHPPNLPQAISGCRYISPIPINFGFPIGGFGAILTRRTLQNMRRPIHCEAPNDKFTQFACWRLLNENNMLEHQFFRDGMSVADLLIAYANGLPFSKYKEWEEGNGFCFHSDLALAYFVNYYHVAVRDDVIAKRAISDQMRMKHLGFINLNNSKTNDQCQFEGEKCNASSKICHYVTPTQMLDLWNASME